MTDPWQLDIGALAQAYADRTLSPVEALGSVLARLDAVNPQINAVIARDDSAAYAAARESERRWLRGAPLSALDGVPISVKDNIPVAGMPCRWGSALYPAHPQWRDESPVQRLRDAGALLFAKTNVPEFTLQGYTDNLVFGTTRNPWATGLTPGGSSGGAAAAVAAGIGPAALATDGGGSIRRPAAYTGLVGLKPSWGTVPRAHGLPEMLPGLEVVGPIARSTADVMRVLQVIAPTLLWPLDPLATPTPQPLRIAHWSRIAGSPVDPVIAQRMGAVASQLRDMGHLVREADAPTAVHVFNRLAWPVLSATGLAAVLHDSTPKDDARMTPALAAMLVTGRSLRAVDLFNAQAHQRALSDATDRVFEEVDLVLTPACAAMPWPAEQSHPTHIDGRQVDPRGHAVFTAFVNGAGLPALALPAEPSPDGLPIGFQLIGPHGSDALLCALGLAFERLQPPARRWPLLSLSESQPA